MNISTSDITTINPYLHRINMPQSVSHKGQNGKVLIIGGSSLFHGAVLWSAEAAAHIVDMVHVASTTENNDIIKSIKTMWQTGMVISQKDIPHYASEDSVILIGNGMMREGEEGEYTKKIVHDLIIQFPEKQFIFDAGALQMMEANWLTLLHKKAIITPHQKEFQTLFGIDISSLPVEEKEKIVYEKAGEYGCIILLKAIEDIVSDGAKTVKIHGGNAGLTKGGTGDVLAGLVAGMCSTSDPFSSAVISSIVLKKTAEELFSIKGYWYTVRDILSSFPGVFHSLVHHS
jgi:NAD(P)H-hydrate epimerase